MDSLFQQAAQLTPQNQIYEDNLLCLFYLHRYKFLTVDQVKAILSLQIKREGVYKRLRALEGKKLIGSFSTPKMGYGRVPIVFFLKEKGYEMLVESKFFVNDEISAFKKSSEPSWSQVFYHRQQLIDVLIAVENSIQSRPKLSLLAVFTEYQKSEEGGSQTSDEFTSPMGGTEKIVPDAALVIRNEEQNKCVLLFVELDRGTERIRTRAQGRYSLHEKFSKYEQYLHSGHYRERYQAFGAFESFRMLFITTGSGRVQNIRQDLGELPSETSAFFLLQSQDQIDDDFLQTSWFSRDPTDENLHRLIG